LGEVITELERVKESSDRKFSQFQLKIDDTETKTIWKIKDCEELLKQRVNKQYITNSIDSSEERLTSILKKFEDSNLE
jgi:rRNA-processing protein FCF1